MARADVGVIGGSGLYQIDGLSDVDEVQIETPYGSPSDTILTGILDGVPVAFLPRHGKGHRLLPSEVPYRANIYALKLLGVKQIVSASAVGSLREDYRPMDMVVPDQLFDRTKNRLSTFFGNGVVAHVAFAEPYCHRLSAQLVDASSEIVPRTHPKGTYVCMEGPAFSTKAESETYRRLGFDIIGMTAIPEAKLAREAGICYATLAQVTDYDCWHADHDSVTSDMVMANVAANSANATGIIRGLIRWLDRQADCSCRHAVEGAVATEPGRIDAKSRERLAPLLDFVHTSQ